MKKIFLVIMICSSFLVCNADEQTESTNQTEINLDVNTPPKMYKLNKPDYHNDIKSKPDDDIDLPIDFLPTPLKLLKMYEQDNL